MTSRTTFVEEVVDGDRCLRLSNEWMTVTIDVDHGAHLYELIDRRSGVDLLYTDPAGPREYAVGGWYELFPNAGPACELEGNPITAHGDVQHARWSGGVTSARGGDIVVALSSTSSDLPFTLIKTITLSATTPVLRVEETVTNSSSRRLPYLWGQHVTFGEPFLTGAVIEPPMGTLHGTVALGSDSCARDATVSGELDRFPTSAGGTIDLRRFPDHPLNAMLFSDALIEHRYAIVNPRLGIRADVSWDGSTWPYLWFWALRENREGGIVACAIEPQSCDVPVLSEALAAGSCPSLEAGESVSAWIEFRLDRSHG
jgi:galactose mutarotase-like enzyme